MTTGLKWRIMLNIEQRTRYHRWTTNDAGDGSRPPRGRRGQRRGIHQARHTDKNGYQSITLESFDWLALPRSGSSDGDTAIKLHIEVETRSAIVWSRGLGGNEGRNTQWS